MTRAPTASRGWTRRTWTSAHIFGVGVAAWLSLAACDALRQGPLAASSPLGYRLPADCRAEYSMRVWWSVPAVDAGAPRHSPPSSPDAEYFIALSSESDDRAEARWISARAPAAGPTRRSLDLGRTQVGPAAPDAPCRDRDLDPFEDFVALAFVQLNRPNARVGQGWQGARVSGDGSRCASPGSCCAGLLRNVEDARDPAHAPRVRQALGTWTEHRSEVDSGASERHIVIESTWSNSLNGPQMRQAWRFVDFDPAAGRVLRSQTESEIAALGSKELSRRRVEIVALDRCDGIQPLAADPAIRDRLLRLLPDTSQH